MRDALNHSETPHNNISIVYLFSLFSPRLVGGGKKGNPKEQRIRFHKIEIVGETVFGLHWSVEYHRYINIKYCLVLNVLFLLTLGGGCSINS